MPTYDNEYSYLALEVYWIKDASSQLGYIGVQVNYLE